MYVHKASLCFNLLCLNWNSPTPLFLSSYCSYLWSLLLMCYGSCSFGNQFPPPIHCFLPKRHAFKRFPKPGFLPSEANPSCCGFGSDSLKTLPPATADAPSISYWNHFRHSIAARGNAFSVIRDSDTVNQGSGWLKYSALEKTWRVRIGFGIRSV